MKTLGGVLVTHDCIRLDYCWEQALRCLLNICDEVVVVDAESTDGTREVLESKYAAHVKMDSAPWKPSQNGAWLADLHNIGRRSLSTRMYFYLQADEVVRDDDFRVIRLYSMENRPVRFNRINFWRDTKTVVPHGHVCGHDICRMDLRSVPVVGDAENIDCNANPFMSGIRIFHYGFLRKHHSFMQKSREMLPHFYGMDARLEKADAEGKHWTEHVEFPAPFLSYNEDHPRIMNEWLQERGYTI